MRLVELEPKWIHPDVFVFKCPHCKADWLSCKVAPMRVQEQFDVFEKEFGEDWNMKVVPTSKETAWNVTTRDFETMSVTPSLNASNSGHWHGVISKGEIIG